MFRWYCSRLRMSERRSSERAAPAGLSDASWIVTPVDRSFCKRLIRAKDRVRFLVTVAVVTESATRMETSPDPFRPAGRLPANYRKPPEGVQA